MIRPGVMGWPHVRGVVLLAATVALMSACSVSEPGQPQSASSPSTAVTSTAPTTTSSPPGSAPRSSVPATGAVPGDCTATGCPALTAPQAEFMSGRITEANAAARVPGYLSAVLDDLDEAWTPWFGELGWGDPAPGRVLIEGDERFQSRCTEADGSSPAVTSDTPNAFFCPLDTASDGSGHSVTGSVILPVEAFVGIWTGVFLTEGPLDSISGFQGEFTAATVVAHEYGHVVVDRIMQAGGLTAEPVGENSELIADCLAGNWAATVLQRDELSITDIVQAVALLGKIGDPAPGQGHGTATQRIKAISLGFFGPSVSSGRGQPVNCLSRYWPEVFR